MADWTAPALSFDAVTITAVAASPQQGDPVDLRRVLTDHAVQWIVTHDADDTWTLYLRGSLDGVHWYDLGGTYPQGSPTGSSGTDTALYVVELKPARYVRAVGYQHGSGAGAVTSLLTSRE